MAKKRKNSLVYTLGNSKEYDKLLKENDLVKSKGGSVWRTIESINGYLKRGGSVTINGKVVEHGIYILDAIWEVDVKPKSKNFGTILRKAKVISKYTK